MSGGWKQLIARRYELVDQAGEGGMATVWRALQHGAAGFSRQVAVKHIKPEFQAIQNYINMFVEEARVGSDLAHPNIVQVHDFIIDDKSYYLVMEWVEGMDLGTLVRAFLKARQTVPWQLITAVCIDALRGLSAAHERRRHDGGRSPVIHRDVSPHNILINLDGWAMRPASLAALIGRAGRDCALLVVEGVMGLFDGAPGGGGATADLAALTGWPVVLLVDARGLGASAAALV